MAQSAQPSWSFALFGAALEKTGSSEVQLLSAASDLARQVSSDKNKLDFLEREFKQLCISMQHKSQIWIHVSQETGGDQLFSYSERF